MKNVELHRRRFLHLATGAAALPALSRIARAQTYPSRPITLVVPYAAGGPTDVIARVLGERMRSSLGQPLLVENIVGAGGTIALGRVARAAPDGYTILIGNVGTHVFLGATYRLDYDLMRNFSPIAQVVDRQPQKRAGEQPHGVLVARQRNGTSRDRGEHRGIDLPTSTAALQHGKPCPGNQPGPLLAVRGVRCDPQGLRSSGPAGGRGPRSRLASLRGTRRGRALQGLAVRVVSLPDGGRERSGD